MQSEITPSWAQGPYSIKRHGATITNCDMEPVQTPGCVQDHGLLLVLRPEDLTIAQVSENAERWLRRSPRSLLDQPASSVLGVDGATRVREMLGSEPVQCNALYAFTLPAAEDGVALDVTVHTVDNCVIVEMEAVGRRTFQSTDYYSLVKKTVTRLQTATSLQAFCDITTQEFRALTGLDRVMVYKFHDDRHGEVFAESKRDDLAPWLGLHYPADDIPRPAREIFQKIWVRPVPDVSAPLHELVPLAHPDTGRPLDMTYCSLRGASVMYTEYLRNMRVSASFTLPIRRETELWGLIACHHYSEPKFVPFAVRAACEFLAQVVSLQHKAAEEREQLVYKLKLEGVHNQLVAAAAREGGLSAMTDGKPNLLDAINAGGAALYHRDRWWRVGDTPEENELDALADWLDARPEFQRPRPLYVTDSLVRDYPAGGAFAHCASGVMATALARRGRNVMMWFRPETIQTVNWAGNPDDKPLVPGPNGPRLTPRVSFDLFRSSVRNRSYPWLAAEVEAVARLRLLVMELVVARAERLAELNADLARSNEELDAFAYVASHDLKEPLRGIHKYAHQLLESATQADAEQRAKLEGLMRLTVRMDSLLDSLLHFSRVGRTKLVLEEVDLNELMAEAIEMVGARSAHARSEISVPRPLPRVCCDAVRVREILQNLLSNALKYNDKEFKRIEVCYFDPQEARGLRGLPESAIGQTVFCVRDNGIGIDTKHFNQIFGMFKRLHGRDQYGGGTGAGLTIVKKLIERHGGTIWLESMLGEGTRFYFTLSDRSA